MKRSPTIFTLVLILLTFALFGALGLSAFLVSRSGLHLLGQTYGRLAVATTLAADDIASRHDSDAQKTLAELQRIGVRFSIGQPPPATVRIAPAVTETGRIVGDLLGDPSRVVVTQTTESQIWIRSAHDPQRWIVLHAASFRTEVIDTVLLVSAIAGLLTLIIAGFGARLLTRPLARLSAHAGALLAGAPMHEQLAGSSREVQHLAASISAAGARLRAAAQERELMLAGISHDLRTPLARLRIALELGDARDPQRAEAMVADLDELDSALEQCLSFVRDGRDEALRDCEVATVVGQLLALRANHDNWHYDGPAELHANVRQTLLRRAIGNLMDNAERHGEAPFRVELARDAGSLSVRVVDHGSGVPAELLDQLGKPFVRGDHARSSAGVGLGLSIVARAAELHGGELQLRNGEHGGFVATLRIPNLPSTD